MSLWFWDVQAPMMRTRAQEAAIHAIRVTAQRMIEKVEKSNTPWEQCHSYFHLECSRDVLNENNYFRDHTGRKIAIRRVDTITESAWTNTARQ